MCHNMLSLRKSYYTPCYLDNAVTRNGKYNDTCMLCQLANNANPQFDLSLATASQCLI